MNQHQRKFLLEAIEKQYKLECDALRRKKPEPPSLNNFLIAAILDGSFEMKPIERVRELIRTRVRELGKTEALVVRSSSRWSRSRDDDEDDSVVEVPVDVLFELPPAYAAELETYEKAKAQWDADEAALGAAFRAMQIKVQTGSDDALEELVQQADNLCAMSLTASSRLLMPAKPKPAQLAGHADTPGE